MHSDIFDLKIPNCIRALIGAFGQNHSQFHAKDGSGFKFMGSVIKTIDGFNPSMASSLSGNFKYYQKLDSIRKEKAGKVLQDILLHPQLSKNTYEIISRTLV
jgi:aminopeptidase N